MEITVLNILDPLLLNNEDIVPKIVPKIIELIKILTKDQSNKLFLVLILTITSNKKINKLKLTELLIIRFPNLSFKFTTLLY